MAEPQRERIEPEREPERGGGQSQRERERGQSQREREQEREGGGAEPEREIEVTRSTRFCRHDKRGRAARDQTQDCIYGHKQHAKRPAARRHSGRSRTRPAAALPPLPSLPSPPSPQPLAGPKVRGRWRPGYCRLAASRHRQVCTGLRALPQVRPVSLFLTLPQWTHTTKPLSVFTSFFLSFFMTDNCISQ